MIEVFFWLLIAFLLSFIVGVTIFIIIPLVFLFGASFERTDEKTLKTMLQFAHVKKNEMVVDLGSGDGTIIIAFAREGAIAHGYETNPLLVLWTKWRIYRSGLNGKAFVHWKNFWGVDLGKFDVVTTFQVGFMMNALEKKLLKEARKNIRVVSNNWEFPNLKPVKKTDDVFLYEIKV